MPKKHGHNTDRCGQTPTYRSWNKMRGRCLNPNDYGYRHYGGRGIKCCARWADFAAFLADMGERPDGMELDRIDNDGPYSPENCRWATRSRQMRNTRCTRMVAYQGEEVSVADLSDRLGIMPYTLRGRIDRGWPEELWAIPPDKNRYIIPRKGSTYSARG